MKTKQFFRNSYAIAGVLFVTILLIASSCTKDVLSESQSSNGGDQEEIQQHVEHFDYQKRNINFKEFANKINASGHKKGINGRSPVDLSFVHETGYVVEINTSQIIEFDGEDLSTYTFNVRTIDEDHLSFTNLIYVERADEFTYGLVRYTPTEDWVLAKQNGEDVLYEGDIDLLDIQGNILETHQPDGTFGGSNDRGMSPCIFSAEPVIQECYGASCPCPDGNGLIVGWEFTISCNNWQGGGSGSSGGNSGGAGGSGNGGNPNGTNLPTDPVAWGIMVDLNNLKGSNDFFYFDETLNPNNCLIFNSYQDFENDFNGTGLDNVEVINEQDGTFTTHFSFNTGLSHINVYANQILENPATNTNYIINSIVTSLSGFTLGRTWNVNQTNFTLDPTNHEATVHVYGTLGYDSFIEGFGVYYQRFFHFIMKIDMLTGQQVGVQILEE